MHAIAWAELHAHAGHGADHQLGQTHAYLSVGRSEREIESTQSCERAMCASALDVYL